MLRHMLLCIYGIILVSCLGGCGYVNVLRESAAIAQDPYYLEQQMYIQNEIINMTNR